LSVDITPWTELYRPSNLDQVVGNAEAISSLRQWFDSWSADGKRKVALLHGPAGTGKTSSVIALAKERQYELVEMNASDTRNKNSVMRIAGSSAKEGTLTGGARGKRILLIDEVDGLAGREDRGGVQSLIAVIKESSVPIICTANDAYSSKLSPLRKLAKVIAYRPLPTEDILRVLKSICRKQKISLDIEDLTFIAEHANGDLRSAINDLQGTVLQLKKGQVTTIELLRPYRDQAKDIQQALKELFTAKSFLEGKHAIDGLSMQYDELLLWVFENADKHTSQERLAEVYTTIADADRFLGRIIRRQKWHLLSYFFDLVSGGVSTLVDQPSKAVNQYTFPQKIALYAQTRFSRALRDSIATAVAEKVHTSKLKARNEVLFLVKEIMNSSIGDAANLAYWLELDDNQIKALVEDSAKVPRIKKVLKAMEEDRIRRQTSMGKIQYSSFDRPGDDWSAILEAWQKKKEQMLAEEQRRKEEAKRKKAEARKAAKKAAGKGKGSSKKPAKKTATKQAAEKDQQEPEDKKQPSLDQFF